MRAHPRDRRLFSIFGSSPPERLTAPPAATTTALRTSSSPGPTSAPSPGRWRRCSSASARPSFQPPRSASPHASAPDMHGFTRPSTIDQQSFAIDQKPCVADRLLMGFDRRSTEFDHNSSADCLVIPVQDKSCPYTLLTHGPCTTTSWSGSARHPTPSRADGWAPHFDRRCIAGERFRIRAAQGFSAVPLSHLLQLPA